MRHPARFTRVSSMIPVPCLVYLFLPGSPTARAGDTEGAQTAGRVIPRAKAHAAARIPRQEAGKDMPRWDGRRDVQDAEPPLRLHRGNAPSGVLHRERGLTLWTRQRACPPRLILQHVEPCLFETIWASVVLRDSGKCIDRRPTVQGCQLILAA
jgi:hypothetical protein